jgi:hypothetical protein
MSMESSIPGWIYRRTHTRARNQTSRPRSAATAKSEGRLRPLLWMRGSCDGPGFGRERGGGCLRRGRSASSDKDRTDRGSEGTDLRLRTREREIANCGGTSWRPRTIGRDTACGNGNHRPRAKVESVAPVDYQTSVFGQRQGNSLR